jgi:flagellin
MINSILTNYGSMAALQSLQATQAALLNTQNQVASGLRVATAKDDASDWVTATTTKSNISSLQQVSQNLGNADSMLGTAVAGATSVSSLVTQIRAKVASVSDPSTNVAATQAEVDQLVNQINATVQSSAFNGVNLLDNSHATGLTFVAATANDYTAAGAASSTISTGAAVDLRAGDGTVLPSTNVNMKALFNLVDSAGTGGGLAAIAAGTTTMDNALKTVDTAASTVTGVAAQYGAVQTNVEGQQTFVNNLVKSLQSGVSNMVDADMTAESARLSALQVQQQLGTQALSIANQAPQLILKLFG